MKNITLLTVTLLLASSLHAMIPQLTRGETELQNSVASRDIDEKEDGDTPTQASETAKTLAIQLIDALRDQDLQSAQALIEQKADVNYFYTFGTSNREHKLVFDTKTPRYLCKYSLQSTYFPPLWLAIACINPDTPSLVQQLIQAKADVNSSPLYRRTCLHLLQLRSVDERFDPIQNHQLTHELIFAGTRYHSHPVHDEPGICEKLDPIINQARHNRNNARICQLLARNPAFMFHRPDQKTAQEIFEESATAATEESTTTIVTNSQPLPAALFMLIKSFLIEPDFINREPTLIPVTAAAPKTR